MHATYYLNANELDEQFLAALKVLFKDQELQITVSVGEATSDLLFQSEPNQRRLLEAVDFGDDEEQIVSIRRDADGTYRATADAPTIGAPSIDEPPMSEPE